MVKPCSKEMKCDVEVSFKHMFFLFDCIWLLVVTDDNL